MRMRMLLPAVLIGAVAAGTATDTSAGEILRRVRDRVAYRVSNFFYPPTPLAVYVDPLGPAFIYPPPGPIGHRITWRGPNGYSYEPLYPKELDEPEEARRAELARWRGEADEFTRDGEEIEAPLDDQRPLPPLPGRRFQRDDGPWEF